MIKALLFDWGGVMSNGGRGYEISERLVRNLDITTERADGLVHLIWREYVRGLINEADVWSKIEKEYGKTIPEAKRKIWNTWDDTSLIPEMGNFVQDLRKQGYHVGLVSNTIPNTSKEIRGHGGYSIFDFAVLSHEVKAAKPDEAIYVIAMEQLKNIQSSEVIFVDDQEVCLETARAIGMQTVLAQNVPQTIHDVKKLLEKSQL
jgi:epoxide hydrolase-like predicted phosphatase